MAKDREAVTCNGRAAFFAAIWDDIRQCAMDNGWDGTEDDFLCR